jgi:hypothetical protein
VFSLNARFMNYLTDFVRAHDHGELVVAQKSIYSRVAVHLAAAAVRIFDEFYFEPLAVIGFAETLRRVVFERI